MIKEYINPSMLEDNSHHTIEEEVRYDFSAEEMGAFKDSHFELSLHMSRRKAFKTIAGQLADLALPIDKIISTLSAIVRQPSDVAEWIDTIDERISEQVQGLIKDNPISPMGDIGYKQLVKDFSASTNRINRGYEIRDQLLYAIDYQEEGRMAYYDQAGRYVRDRPLKATERQASITSLLTTKTA